MFKGNYNFFDYKYNISGYNGQDFGGISQYLYLIISILSIIFLLVLLRKKRKDDILKIIKVISIFLILFYIGKTTWESVFDIKYSGKFNTGLLPFDACSMVMLAGVICSFGKGRIKEYATCWLATGCIVGGISNMLFLNALKYYPFMSFGAFYSMIWHFLMVFIGLLIISNKYVDIKYSVVLRGYLFHLLISLFIIPIDFIFNFDFMLYLNLGGVPIFENVASNFTLKGLQILNPIMMLILYFIAFNIVFSIPLLIEKLKKHH